MELGFSSGVGPLIPPGRGCEHIKNLKLAQLRFGSKFLCGFLKFRGLNVEMVFSSGGDPLIPPGRGC
jgi:hypothetical protein